jgi:hypothetical protein
MTKTKYRIFADLSAVVFVCALFSMSAVAKWKPEYEKNPQEVTEWFKKAYINPQALDRLLIEIQSKRLFESPQRPLTGADKEWMNRARTTQESRKRPDINMVSCCHDGDRVKTKFSVDRSSGHDKWTYLDPVEGVWKEIPEDIIHYGNDDPSVPKMPEALKREGVLFVYRSWDGKFIETCFWPPEEGG